MDGGGKKMNTLFLESEVPFGATERREGRECFRVESKPHAAHTLPVLHMGHNNILTLSNGKGGVD